MINVKATYLTNYRVSVEGGYDLHSGWTVVRADTGAVFTTDGARPWMPIGGKRAATSVQNSGLLPCAAFIEAA